jgi:hypothetical protein
MKNLKNGQNFTPFTNKKFLKKMAGHPLGSKRAQGHPLVVEGHGALLKMPSRSTTLFMLLEE